MNQPLKSAPVALRMMVGRFDNRHGRRCSTCLSDRNLLVLGLRRCVPHTTKETRGAEAFFDPR